MARMSKISIFCSAFYVVPASLVGCDMNASNEVSVALTENTIRTSVLDKFRGQSYYVHESDGSIIFFITRAEGVPMAPELVNSRAIVDDVIRVVLRDGNNIVKYYAKYSNGIDLGSNGCVEINVPSISKYGLVMFKNSRGAIVYAAKTPPVAGLAQGYIARTQFDNELQVRYEYAATNYEDHEKVSALVIKLIDSFYQNSQQSIK